jgi:pimeloyl-ACP methyl ester carboxylesterase
MGLRRHPGEMLREETFPANVAMLYMYGTRKPFFFHTKTWLKNLQNRSDCEVHELNASFHWLSRDEPQKVNELAAGFLERHFP